MTNAKIYTSSTCPYCNQAKDLFKKLNLSYEEINLDRDPELRMKLSEENKGWRTVPMIFVNDKFLGGYSDVKALHDNGQFLPLFS